MNTQGHLLEETDQRAIAHFDKLFNKIESDKIWANFKAIHICV